MPNLYALFADLRRLSSYPARVFMKPFLPAILGLLLSSPLPAEDDAPPENPAAKQFREHLLAADKNKDSIVTRDELLTEIKKSPRDGMAAGDIADRMLADLDTDGDGQLSAAEIEAGAVMAGRHYLAKQNILRAQQIMEWLGEYRKAHDGALPAKLEDLAKQDGVKPEMLKCFLPDGHEKPWAYAPTDEKKDQPRAVIIYALKPLEEKYILGLMDGDVVGIGEEEVADLGEDKLGGMTILKDH